MDLHKKNKLDMVTVYDLMNNSFYIPDYQRGYRWTKFEVQKLLQDLEDFFASNPDGHMFYCLQPLVVFYNNEKKAWEVIDGQQRLTTLYLILSQQKDLLKQIYPDADLFSLSYQSRPDSQAYLQNIDEKKMKENIDYYHMYNAVKEIEGFLKITPLGSWRFIDAIFNANNNASTPSVKFIWYNVTEEIESKNITSEDKFSDLNIGKINLTNAELIKALFINNVSENESEALRISSEWDNIENSLQNDDFWSFVYGDDDGKYTTRIEFLFDIIKNKNASETHDYYTFDNYLIDIKNNRSVKDLWKEITDKFYRFQGWYEDKNLYHIIGYLRYKHCSMQDIESIFVDPETKSNTDFFSKLKAKALEDFSGVNIKDLSYVEDRKKIKDILVLFNILSILSCEKDNLRFSFNNFYKDSWDIEHIRSQTPKGQDGEDRRDWITCNIEYFSGIMYDKELHDKNFDSYKDSVQNSINKDVVIIPGYTIGKICEELLDLYSTKTEIGKSPIYDVLVNSVFKQDGSFINEDGIGNLVLLDQGTNRGYKNAFFPVKRKWINKREQEGIYILPCTKNVFSKNYSKVFFDLMNWNNDDYESYVKEIERIIHNGKTKL